MLVIFQPHRYTRTAALREEFGRCFGDADHVWVLDVYAAGETPIEGVSGHTIVEAAARPWRGARRSTRRRPRRRSAAAAAAAARATRSSRSEPAT